MFKLTLLIIMIASAAAPFIFHTDTALVVGIISLVASSLIFVADDLVDS